MALRIPDSAPSTIGELPAFAARVAPGKTALVTPERSYSFSELAERTLAAARGFAALGVAPGERIAILLPNGLPNLHAYFAASAAGGVPVPINTFLAAPEVASVIEDSESVGLVVTRKRLAALASWIGGFRALRFVVLVEGEGSAEAPAVPGVRFVDWENLAVEGRGRSLPPAPSPGDLAVLTYTSGTTGRIKGVMLTHANLLANARGCLDAVRLQRKDRLLLFLPMFHSLTQTVCLILPRMATLPVVLLPGVDRVAIRSALRKHRPTIFLAVPAVYAAMADNAPAPLVRWLNPIRVYLSGAAPLPRDVLERFERAWRRPLCEGYGLSEAAPVVCLNPVDGVRKGGSVGPPISQVEIRIVGEDGADLPAGEVGEILVRGPNVMAGYHRRPEETASALRDGWLHTGDLGRRDEDGYLFIVGRQKEMLIFRGMNVYPREIEEVLAGHPDVSEAAVIGLDDAQRGEVPHAAVALRRGGSVSERALRSYCKARLALYKVPRSILILPSLPRNPTGKIQKDLVREAIQAARAGSALSPEEAPEPGS